MKKIALMGSTGSIGTQTLDVVRKYPEKLEIFALSVGSDIDLLYKQIKEFSPKVVGVANPEKAKQLQKKVDIEVLTGENMLEEIARMEGYDTFVSATVGLTIIRATLEAIKNKKSVALANKETLVAAGEIVMREAKANGVQIMPIDSEHSALFQCLNGENKKNIKSLIVTCSGGALRDYTKEELKNVSIEDALRHKTWQMGKKITIDSATLMNKGFEVIEAMHLYDVEPKNIQVVIHKESIIHSMVEYCDNSIIAQISEPDMRLPIQYALSYPDRWEASIKRHNFNTSYTFEKPDMDRFPCLSYAFRAMEIGGTMPAVMNAANDVMVDKFLLGKCAYLDIPKTIKQVMDEHKAVINPTLKDIENAINETTKKVEKLFE